MRTNKQQFQRKDLYELVWSEPMKTLAARFGISDVALSKTCRRHGIPVPPRGHWAKLQAGKKVTQQPLPPRGLGMPEIIGTRRSSYWVSNVAPDNLITMEIPPPPVFEESISDLKARVRTLIGKVAIPRDFKRAHRSIAKLLADDEERRQKQLASRFQSRWDDPYFESPFERRRLRLVNAIFLALERCGMSCSSRGKNPNSFEVRVGEEGIWFSLDHPKQERTSWHSSSEKGRPASDKLLLTVSRWRTGDEVRYAWEDRPNDPIESHVDDIVINIILAGEVQYREGEIANHRWLIKRKAELIEEARKREEQEEREREERRRLAEQARVDRLLSEATAFRQAIDIRSYVDQVRRVNASSGDPVPEGVIEAWASWALAQADRIDPTVDRRFLTGVDAEDD